MNSYPWACGLTRCVFKGEKFSALRAAYDSQDSARVVDALTQADNSRQLELNYVEADYPMLVYADCGSLDSVTVCPNGEEDDLLCEWQQVVSRKRYFGTVEFDLANTCRVPAFDKLYINPHVRGRVKLRFDDGRLRLNRFDYRPVDGEWQFNLDRHDVAMAYRSRSELALGCRSLLILAGRYWDTGRGGAIVEKINAAVTHAQSLATQLCARLFASDTLGHMVSDDALRVARTAPLRAGDRDPGLTIQDTRDFRVVLAVGYAEVVDALHASLADSGAILYLSPLDKMFQWSAIERACCAQCLCATRRIGESVHCALHDASVRQPRLDDVVANPRWVNTAFCRWPRNHAKIVDVCFALLDEPFPPYVLLEILDWLPAMHWQNHIAKIRLIESVRASMRRVRQKRADSNKHRSQST